MKIKTEVILEEALFFIADLEGNPCERMADFYKPGKLDPCGECLLPATEGEYNEDERGCWRQYFELTIQKRKAFWEKRIKADDLDAIKAAVSEGKVVNPRTGCIIE